MYTYANTTLMKIGSIPLIPECSFVPLPSHYHPQQKYRSDSYHNGLVLSILELRKWHHVMCAVLDRAFLTHSFLSSTHVCTV